MISAKTTEGLLSYGFDLSPQPQLATAWSVSADGLQYTFTLRRGVKWHDGRPFTSADVAHSIGLLKQYLLRAGAPPSRACREVRTPDAHTAILVLSKPAPYLITAAVAAAESPIVPKHLYESGKPIPANGQPTRRWAPAPSSFKEWVRGSHVSLRAQPRLLGWPQALRRPADRALHPRRRRARGRGDREGRGRTCARRTPVPPGDVERPAREAEPACSSRTATSTSTTSRAWSSISRTPRCRTCACARRSRMPSTAGGAEDRVVRPGTADPGPVHPALAKFYVPDLLVLPHDPKQAEALLDAAGLTRGKAGPNLRLKLALTPIPNEGGQRTAEYLKQSLGRIGIEVTINATDFADLRAPHLYRLRLRPARRA